MAIVRNEPYIVAKDVQLVDIIFYNKDSKDWQFNIMLANSTSKIVECNFPKHSTAVRIRRDLILRLRGLR